MLIALSFYYFFLAPYDANFDKNSGIWEVKPQKPTSCEWARIEANDALQDHTTGIGMFRKTAHRAG